MGGWGQWAGLWVVGGSGQGYLAEAVGGAVGGWGAMGRLSGRGSGRGCGWFGAVGGTAWHGQSGAGKPDVPLAAVVVEVLGAVHQLLLSLPERAQTREWQPGPGAQPHLRPDGRWVQVTHTLPQGKGPSL